MEAEIIKLKQEVDKLKRECYEKYSEIETLAESNKKLKEDLKSTENLKLSDSQDIVFHHEEVLGTQSILLNKKLGTSSILMLKTTQIGIKFASNLKFFEGDFGYQETSHNFVPHSEWEFVIVCPNPDLITNTKTSVSKTEAFKWFRKGFKPEYSKKLSTLIINQQSEQKAFLQLFESLPNSDEENGKAFRNGGRFKVLDSARIFDSRTPCKDFLTLMRNILLVKLGMHLGLHTKQIMSSNGKYIYVLVCADDQDLKNEAEAINYNLQLEIGEVDLPSLEPCDIKLRPFRLLECNVEAVNNVHEELKKEFPDIMDMFKTLESEDNSYNDTGVLIGHWHTYLEYIKELQKSLREMAKYTFSPHQKHICLQKIMKKSIEIANKQSPKEFKLKNLWERMGFSKPLSPYFDYIRKIDPRTKEDSFKHLWKRYSCSNKEKKVIFSAIDRIKLLYSLIQRQVDLHYLSQKEIISAFFPLKSNFELLGINNFTNFMENPTYQDDCSKLLNSLYIPKRKGLLNKWGSKIICQPLPTMKIRNYFGEKIGLYFAFVSFFGNFLSIPSFIGVVIFILQRLYDAEDIIVIVSNAVYCIYVATWATSFIEYWKRKESCLAINWGQTDYQEDEVPRPQFHGESRRSPVDDDMDDVFFDPKKRYLRFVFSGFVTVIFIGMVVTCVIFIILLRWELTGTLVILGTDVSGPLCSLLNAFQIQVFNFIFNRVAVKLNNLENHRTQSEYEDSLIVKSYLFQFVNSFFSLFYIAFFKTQIEGCLVQESTGSVRIKGASCTDELYLQFISIFSVSFLKNIIELGIPYIKSKIKHKEFAKTMPEVPLYRLESTGTEIETLRDQIEAQFQLPAYITKEVDGTLGDYLELAILFGYITLFAVAFPLSGVLTYLAVLVEIYVDRYKLLYMVRRPIPLGAKDISTWRTIFVFMSIISIVTNSAIICFTLPTFDHWSIASDNRILIFAVFCIFLLFLRSIIAFGIPDIPHNYQLIIKRHDKIIQRVIKGWEINKNKVGSNQVYVNPNIYCTIKNEEVA